MSTRTDVAAAAERVLKPIQQFVRGWMMTPTTEARAAELGMRSGTDLWVVGRAGVLGDCDADVAACGLAFHSPSHVRAAWESLPAGLTHRAVAAAYAELCADWGRQALTAFDPARMARLDELGRRVIDAAPPTVGPVFAGWRAMPQPADAPARAALTGHVLREMRGGAHIIAIQACGLTPLEAILASPAAPPRSGPEWATRMGFEGPYPDAEQFREARAEAERLTSMLMGRYFATLDEAELAEFAELIETTRNAIEM
jgi:hypothetical protein